MNPAYERPYRPSEITESIARSFPLLSMADQLLSEEVIENTGRNSLTLARGSDMTVVLLVLRDRAVLHEHKAPGPITVTALKGHIEFTAEGQSKAFSLHAGEAAVCAPHLPHSVKALEDSVFLLVIGGRME